MKKLEWLALLIIILHLLTHFLNMFGGALIARLYSPEYVGVISLHMLLMTSARSILSIIVNVVIGIWLFIQARQAKSTPWIWLLFGLFYGLIAAVLFYLLKIYESKICSNAGVPLPETSA
jgi:hypothetical protein